MGIVSLLPFDKQRTSFVSRSHANITYRSLQACLGIITTCIPTLKPIMGSFLKLSPTYGSQQPNPYGFPSGTSGRQRLSRSGYLRQKPSHSADMELESGMDSPGPGTLSKMGTPQFDPRVGEHHTSIRAGSAGAGGGIYPPGGQPPNFSRTFYTHRNSTEERNGSEELILQGNSRTDHAKGIVRTVEVSIDRDSLP